MYHSRQGLNVYFWCGCKLWPCSPALISAMEKQNLLGNTVKNRMCASLSWVCSLKASVLHEVTSCGVWAQKKEWRVPRDSGNSLEITWLGHEAPRADWPGSPALPAHTCSSLTQSLITCWYLTWPVWGAGVRKAPVWTSFPCLPS